MRHTIAIRANSAWHESADHVRLVDAYATASTQALSIHAISLSHMNAAAEASHTNVARLRSLDSKLLLRYALAQRDPARREDLYTALATVHSLCASILKNSQHPAAILRTVQLPVVSPMLRKIHGEAEQAIESAALIPRSDLERESALPSQQLPFQQWKKQKAVDLAVLLHAPPATFEPWVEHLAVPARHSGLSARIDDTLTQRKISRKRAFVDTELQQFRAPKTRSGTT